MDGRRGRQPNPDLSGAVESPPARRRKGRSLNAGEDFPGASDAKLLRKLEAQGEFPVLQPPAKRLYLELPRPLTSDLTPDLSGPGHRDRTTGSSDQDDEEAGEAGSGTDSEGGPPAAGYAGAGSDGETSGNSDEIGRASCRGRV